jgi:hypothetical protein
MRTGRKAVEHIGERGGRIGAAFLRADNPTE